jgi:RNA polymerase sigma-70 factor (ECF subfamily)
LSRTTAVAASDSMDAYAEAHLEIDSDVHDVHDVHEASEANDELAAYADGTDASFDELSSGESADDSVRDPSVGSVGSAGSAGSTLRVTSSMSDEDLLEGIRAQSEEHFAELYRRYFQRIYSFVYTRMRNHAETEEVVQETFLAVFRSFKRYRGQSSLLSWIYGIAKNTTNNTIRRAKSQTERIDLADDDDLIPRPSLGVGTPGEQLDLYRFQDQLAQRLDSLADWQAEIFEMRHFENLSIPEISKRTKRSSDAVRSSLYRVKRIFFDAAQATGMATAMAGDQS